MANDILLLKGRFEQRQNPGKPGPRNIPSNQKIEVQHLLDLQNQLKNLCEFWKEKRYFKKTLVSVHYTDVVAKSNRIKTLLKDGNTEPNDSIVGAKFDMTNGPKHVITHCIEKDAIIKSIELLSICIDIMRNLFLGKLTFEVIEKINKGEIPLEGLSKTKFVSVIVDSFYVESFDIDIDKESIKERSIVTLYKTDVRASEIMRQIGISQAKYQQIDEITFVMNPEQYETLKDNAPYLIAMTVTDIATLTKSDVLEIDEDPKYSIVDPTNEPTIGVIDTHFDEHVYFSKWVKYKNMMSDSIELSPDDYDHGTMVSSIIVDGPTLNPELEDHCGHFQVRHFGVAKNGRSSSSLIMQTIKHIVAENKDIKVWNFSLGSELEINDNFISPEAAVLDQLQFDNDVIFIVSGTNKPDNEVKEKKIGAPADSINSIVVNSVDTNDIPAVYTRIGPVLSFFNKPDVSYYGGTNEESLRLYAPYGVCRKYGTSFAAPWITRKIAFLIYKMGLSREVAKALLIDSAAGWKKQEFLSTKIGYGAVPKLIDDIVQSKTDEIRFIISSVSELYDTYNYNIPVPIYQKAQPFIAKATLCYFPKCSRNQGVDYTDTELDLHFGRITEKGMKPIDNNIQNDEGRYFLKEERARKLFRKWDNIKFIGEELKDSQRARKLYGDGRWGISLKTKERLRGNAGNGLNFGVVITLKEINGQNRIDDFIKLCSLKGWIVNRINVKNTVELFTKAEEDISFE